MKNLLSILTILFFSNLSFSQTIEERVSKLEKEIENIKEVNNTLKDNYQLFKGEQVAHVEEVEIKFIKADGDKIGKTVTVELLVTNLANSFSTACSKSVILDELGNEYPSSKIKMGSNDNWNYVMTYKDAPVKVKMTFSNVSLKSLYVRRLNFELANTVTYKNLPVSIDGAQINWK